MIISAMLKQRKRCATAPFANITSYDMTGHDMTSNFQKITCSRNAGRKVYFLQWRPIRDS